MRLSSWKDVEWISLWSSKLILKGILDLEDELTAAKTGAAALVVSNDGGRQLDLHRPRSPCCRRSLTPSAPRSR